MVCPSGTPNSGKGFSTGFSFNSQRSAISIVRCINAGESGKILPISSALFTKNWSESKRKRSIS